MSSHSNQREALEYWNMAVHPYSVYAYKVIEGLPKKKRNFANFSEVNESINIEEKSPLIEKNETWKENFKDNSAKGTISPAARKRVSRSLDYFLFLAKPKTAVNYKTGRSFEFRIAFVTLTLASPQIHSDKQIIEKVLQPLLNYLRKHYKIERYIWRAEKQKNGNLHFHLLIDKFIPYSDLKDRWNQYQQNLGYVTRYRENQLFWHKNGFKIRDKLLKFWNEEAQYNAYLKGIQENWNNPNTTDIHSIKKVKNVKLYMLKYLTKNSQNGTKTIQSPELEQTQSERSAAQNAAIADIIRGRLWACSESLSKIRGAEDFFTWDYAEELEEVAKQRKSTVISNDHYIIYGIAIWELKKAGKKKIVSLFEEYCCSKFNSG